jgi:hypothetical protein
MRGFPNSAGSVSRRENEFRAGGGTRRHQLLRGVVGLWRRDRMLVVARKGGFCRPAGAGLSWGDGTQRSRAGLPSDGPPGLGLRRGENRSCQGVSGSNMVLLREFSIPMPIPIPIPTRAARFCRAGSSSVGVVSARRYVGWEQCPFATFCDFCGQPSGIEAKGAHAKNRPSTERAFYGNELAVYSASTVFDAVAG